MELEVAAHCVEVDRGAVGYFGAQDRVRVLYERVGGPGVGLPAATFPPAKATDDVGGYAGVEHGGGAARTETVLCVLVVEVSSPTE